MFSISISIKSIPISKLKGKIIIINDRTINPNYEFDSLSPSQQAAILAKNKVSKSDDLAPGYINPYTHPRQDLEFKLFGLNSAAASAKAAAAKKAAAEAEEAAKAAAKNTGDTDYDDPKRPYYNITNYINVDSGSYDLYQHEYSEMLAVKPLEINPSENICVGCDNIRQLRVIVPDRNNLYTTSENKPFDQLLTSWGCQFVPFMYYAKNFDELNSYESFFNDHRTAFVFRSAAIQKIKDSTYPTSVI